MKKSILHLLFVLLSFCVSNSIAQDLTQQIIPNRSNSLAQQQKPYVILISADGFRADFTDKYQAKNLRKLSNDGVTAAYMLPSFPSLTFPNHYSIVTGMYPAHHGLVDNSFYDAQRQESYGMGNKKAVADGSWYGGTPLWVLAEQQQMISASFYWVASESNIQGTLPTYYYNYNDKIDIDTRIQTVKNWLQLPEDKRPHMITFYFPEVDHEAHTYGTDSKETEEAVHFVDNSIGKLVATVDSLHLPVNFVFVSDHGMTKVEYEHPMLLPKAIDPEKFIIPRGDALLQLYAKDKKDIKPTYEALKKEAVDFDVYLKKNIPSRWHYGTKDDKYNRVGDILLVPHLPKVFGITGKSTTPGKHGFDPAIEDMHATFFAWGPAFKPQTKIDGFENVNIYPMISKILGLEYNHKIDGKLKVLDTILKK
ncbi:MULTISPECIES: ectonucleotide pyrophosphatase/phosphodiesterase [unclassified Arcicella]|uniref:alkaline phosphatase family protein n=1 Tax=unclassified Arcicella TaxID=2644986 RepID=UPI00285CECF8|nr:MULTISPECIES: ectonucleotide pyrophosphatase/phosphodiesterase [unclassified Arcicella]MDR6564531.1 putative AlkP superfamily pyrophosphatase or phosphodiesterase [Arcicella sp. BE51]MDR6825759.1 putative AlkP superfamily pyrophosphatase or phosphodiesterase [Arcicella sp. BE139]